MLKYKFPHEVVHLDGVRSMQPCVCYSDSRIFLYKADLNCRKEGGLEGGRKGNGMNTSLIGELLGFSTEGGMKRQLRNDLARQQDTELKWPT